MLAGALVNLSILLLEDAWEMLWGLLLAGAVVNLAWMVVREQVEHLLSFPLIAFEFGSSGITNHFSPAGEELG